MKYSGKNLYIKSRDFCSEYCCVHQSASIYSQFVAEYFFTTPAMACFGLD
jgi:hypothetical protein